MQTRMGYGLGLGMTRGMTAAGPTAFTVLNSAGASFAAPFAVLNSAGTSFTVPQAVLSSDGTSYNSLAA